MRVIPPSLSLRVLFVSTILVACYGAEPTGPKTPPDNPGPNQKPVIALTPRADTLHSIGDTARFSVKMQGPGSSGLLQSTSLSWHSLDRKVADVTDVGEVFSKAVGVALITVGCSTCANKADTATVYVEQVPASVTVTPGGETVTVGDTVQLVAAAADSMGAAIPDPHFTWGSADPNVAVVDDGRVTANRPGTVVITARTGKAVGHSRLTVSDRKVDRIVVTPADTSLAVSDTVRLNAVAYDPSGAEIADASFGWYSSDLSVAVAADSGLVEGKSTGSVTISAKAGGKKGTSQVTITPPRVASVKVKPGQATMAEGDSVRLTATAYDNAGTEISTATFSWITSNKDIARVADGEVVGVTAGSAQISATAAGITGSSNITVTTSSSGEIASISVQPTSTTITVGDTIRLTAKAKDASGSTIDNVDFNWNSSNPAAATVSNGLVTGRGEGAATIHATAAGITGSASVNVNPGDPPPPPPPPPGSLAAFPGAEGYGANALTNCKRQDLEVIPVTNLGNNGQGTLRDAIQRSDPGKLTVIVFRTGGTIQLQNVITINKPCIYIAGQTAPGGGIQIRGPGDPNSTLSRLITVPRDRSAHDIVIRYIRLRAGRAQEGVTDNIQLASSYNVILDHVSTAWDSDKSIPISPTKLRLGGQPTDNITVQWSFITTSLTPHSTGMPIGGQPDEPDTRSISIHHNAFINNTHRNPLIRRVYCIQVINNVVYNWRGRVGRTLGDTCVDFIGNYYKAGPWSAPRALIQHWIEKAGDPDPILFMEANVAVPFQVDPNADQTRLIKYVGLKSGPLPASAFVTSPLNHPVFPVTVTSAATAYDQVLAGAGASQKLSCTGEWQDARDPLDQLLASQVQQGSGPATDAESDDQSDYGGYPVLAAGTACADSDGDGIPDDYESLHGLDPNNPLDAAQDSNGDGYTNIEEYLNGTPPQSP